jgi:signal transduction histidine kinase
LDALSAIWAAIYLLFSYFVLQREMAYGKVAKYLILYSLLSVIWEALNAVQVLGWLSILGVGFWTWQRIFSTFGLSIIFLATSFEFLNSKVRHRLWISLTASWALILFILLIGPLKPSGDSARWKDILVFGGILIGWLTTIAVIGFLVFQAYLSATKPLHRNRIVFWAASALVIVLGDVFLFANLDVPGSILKLTGTFMAGYVVFFHNLLDLAGALQRLPMIFYKTFFALVLYATVLSIPLPRFGFLSESDSIIAEFILKALILVAGVNPILTLFNQYVNRSMMGNPYTQSGVVREYNLAIGQIVDLRMLASVAVEQIVRVLHIQHARLYLVDRAEEEGCFYLQPVVLPGEELSGDAEAGKFFLEGPVVNHFYARQKPLTQYEIDFSPNFLSVDKEERKWLTEQQMDLYVPICTKNSWIGLFALGPKLSGERYFPEDLELLSTLAEQTVIALQNARLFENLRQTQVKLAQANEELKNLDQTKSAFISVVTHELRTPLANIGFSLQVIDMYGKDRLLPEQIEQLDQLSDGVRQARMMIDNLITYATFLNEQVTLDLDKFDFREILREVLVSYKTLADQKGVKFHIDIPGDYFLVWGDRKLLQTAVQHLIHNAVKFTSKGSIWVTCWSMNDALCFDVQDTGIGIPSERLEDIWDAFTQASSDSIRRGVEGLGLGLALVKLIINAHGGFVWVESKHGQGSFFGFQVPLDGPSHPLDEGRAKRLQREALERSFAGGNQESGTIN